MNDQPRSSCTPPDIPELVREPRPILLPSTSRNRYETAYERFSNWKNVKSLESFSENVFLAYFEEQSRRYKPSTLWSLYSMLKSTTHIKHNTDISKYLKLLTFLKRKSEDFVPKKTKVLNPQDFVKFLNTAPDHVYLLVKAVVVVGLAGGCTREELCQLTIDNVEDLKSAMLIKLESTKPRTFTLKDDFYDICKKYASLRPLHVREKRFFVNYRNGKCTKKVVGVNKIGGMAKDIANFLRLPHLNRYSGHCFRRSAATLLVNCGDDLLTLSSSPVSNEDDDFTDDEIPNSETRCDDIPIKEITENTFRVQIFFEIEDP